MPKLIDFEDHLMETLKDPHEAAYFLAACLAEAITETDNGHFAEAILKVAKATGKTQADVVKLLHSHIAPTDFPNVDENMSIMLAKLVNPVESQKNRLQSA